MKYMTEKLILENYWYNTLMLGIVSLSPFMIVGLVIWFKL